eukprot:SAG31_NODE_3361_length_4364_cov_3.184291_1_plen_36_part_00
MTVSVQLQSEPLAPAGPAVGGDLDWYFNFGGDAQE